MSIFCKIGQGHLADGMAEGHRHHSYKRPEIFCIINFICNGFDIDDNSSSQTETSL